MNVRSPFFSIVTVCFNAIDVIAETEISLRKQAFDNYEWVVVDGKSKDGTSEWLRCHTPDVLLIESDDGIYDAMNKAVNLCSGRWLYFLNAGDLLYDDQVLHDVFLKITESDISSNTGVVYGNVVYYGDSGSRRKRFDWLKPHNLVYGDLCHQAAFSRRELYLGLGMFDKTLRFNADFDWFLRVFASGAGGMYIDRDVAFFHDKGAHVLNSVASEAERDIVRLRYVSRIKWLLGHWALRFQFKLKKIFQ